MGDYEDLILQAVEAVLSPGALGGRDAEPAPGATAGRRRGCGREAARASCLARRREQRAWEDDDRRELIAAAVRARGAAGGFVELTREHGGARNSYQWCGPIRSGDFEQARNVEELVFNVGATHGVGLNHGNITGRRRTVEYRYFDSSLDPAIKRFDRCSAGGPRSTAGEPVARIEAFPIRLARG